MRCRREWEEGVALGGCGCGGFCVNFGVLRAHYFREGCGSGGHLGCVLMFSGCGYSCIAPSLLLLELSNRTVVLRKRREIWEHEVVVRKCEK